MSSLAADLGTIIRHLLDDPAVLPAFRNQFKPEEHDGTATVKNLNAAFLIAFTDEKIAPQAKSCLSAMVSDDEWGSAAVFYLEALDRIGKELSGSDLDDLVTAARDLVRDLDTSTGVSAPGWIERFWSIFFPEGAGVVHSRSDAVESLRRKRSVTALNLNTDPVSRTHEQVLFTSNVLLTVPLEKDLKAVSLAPGLRKGLLSLSSEKQAFWYDHPIPLGIDTDRNEAVYGLRGLDRALRFEVERGNAPADAEVPILLSISTTHHGLQALAHEYLAGELEEAGGIDHLRIYAAAERDVRGLLDEVLLPAAGHFFPGRNTEPLVDVLGVDGEYGRHYSFLKGAAALWRVLVDHRVSATFKFDLDQVFPQEVLVSETGRSAFEHLCDPIWGSEGTDSEGRRVEMGMLAGALVNDADIGDGLFTPDVKWPEGWPPHDHWVFASPWPQALSTEAEMMTRYGARGPDGVTSCLQRVHVTGGTTGIMVEHLRRHRPFTPSWIGRAEDQAYLLSVLYPQEGSALRYAHASGLIMRHNKEAFAAEALEAARIGKMVGDYVRILTFTSYARALPWGAEAVKNEVDPFTGCFISRLPVTVSSLRMAIQAAALFSEGSEKAREDGEELVKIGTARLGDAMRDFCDEKEVKKRLDRERAGWDLYYDVLDALESGLERGDRMALSWRNRARELIEGWRIQHAARSTQ